MLKRLVVGLLLFGPLAMWFMLRAELTDACCPAGPPGKLVVNANQTVIMIWDSERKVQHFIRQAAFKSDADDIGFLVPTPSEPELEESGNEAFPMLAQVTAPKVVRKPRPSEGMSCGCSENHTRFMTAEAPKSESVEVLAEKTVAGFDAKVLSATSADVLVEWLNEHGYEFSDAVRVWAEPYVRDGWKFTALKVAKGENAAARNDFGAAALRISFETERPLFPYREPDPKAMASGLNAVDRLLRIYFVADGRFRGELTKEQPWTGQVAWAGKLDESARKRLLEQLRLPEETGPKEFWLTEFEDHWPYEAAPADVYFEKDKNQLDVRRPDVILYVQSRTVGDASWATLGLAALLLPFLFRRTLR